VLSHAIHVDEPGGPEVLCWDASEPGEPGADEALVRHTAVGVNYIDVYFRTALYTPPPHPFVPGMEAAGVVERVGTNVTEFAPGDRVAYASGPLGAYSERRRMPSDRLVTLPDGIDDDTAAAALLKGMTTQYLLTRTHAVQAGETVLIHAAAGGVGSLACQWAKHLGARVIGTVGSHDKAARARRHGCDHPIVYSEEDIVETVRELTAGRGVPVVYDSVGQSTFMQSLDCLAPRGHMVSFGQSSGAVAPLDIAVLSQKGSLSLTRPSLGHYIATREELLATAGDVLGLLEQGVLSVDIGQTFPLAEAARAHSALEARATAGSILLRPETATA
jgi:NADPH2:quinone reductase